MDGYNPLEWGTPRGIALFFVSIAAVVASVGVLLWGIAQLV
jgi:hypothetical protein